MNDEVFLFFNGWGLLGLVVFALAYSCSHVVAVKGLSKADFYARLIGFIAFISIFILSGWKAGLIAIPIGLVSSFIGAA